MLQLADTKTGHIVPRVCDFETHTIAAGHQTEEGREGMERSLRSGCRKRVHTHAMRKHRGTDMQFRSRSPISRTEGVTVSFPTPLSRASSPMGFPDSASIVWTKPRNTPACQHPPAPGKSPHPPSAPMLADQGERYTNSRRQRQQQKERNILPCDKQSVEQKQSSLVVLCDRPLLQPSCWVESKLHWTSDFWVEVSPFEDDRTHPSAFRQE